MLLLTKANRRAVYAQRFMQWYGLLAGILILLTQPAWARPAAEAPGPITQPDFGGLGAPADPAPFMPAAKTGTLPNGFRYYILANAKPENRAYLTLAVNAGSVLEQDGEQGLAHFVEHMAFNGTVRFPESELVNYLRSLGMRFGADVNAYTSYDETVYGIEVPVEQDQAGTKRIPDTALAVISDWTQSITFDPKDVDDERLVIMEEYRSRLGAMDRIRRQLLPILFRGSPYAERRAIGLPEVIEQAPPQKMAEFYKRWYRPDNIALIFVGDFDPDGLETALTAHFTMPKPDTPLNRPRYDLPPPQKGFSAEIFTDPELTFTAIEAYYKRPLQARTGNLAEYREGIVDALIDAMLSERFESAGAKPETPYISAGGGHSRYGTASRFYLLSARAKAGNAEKTLRELLLAKETMIRYGFTAAELDRAKRSLLSYLGRLYAEWDRIESPAYVQEFSSHFLRGVPAPGIAWEFDAIRRLLPGISLQEIAKTAKQYFSAEDVQIFVLAPESEPLPSKDQIKKIYDETRTARIAPPAEETLSDQLLETEPAPGKIIAESADSETGALIWDLSNGGKVILKETANKNNEIVFYALAKGGTSSAPDAEYLSARISAEMLEVSGVGGYALQDLQKKLAGKQVSVSFWTDRLIRGFQGSATGEDIKPFFELIYLYFTQPRMDDSAIQAMLDQYRTVLAQRKENPETFFSQEIQRTISGNHPRYAPLEIEDLDRVRADQALDFIRRGLNPGDYTFVFAGNLPVETLRRYVETYLAGIPAGKSWNTWTDPGIVRPAGAEKLLYKGKEAKSSVYSGRYLRAEYSEEDSAAAAVLEEYLDIRLTEEIREKLGGVYSIFAGVSLSPLPPGELSLTVFFGCDPNRSAELTQAAERELERIASEPPDAGVFAKAVEALQKSWEVSIQRNFTIAQSYANSTVIYAAPLSRLNRRTGFYAGVTPEQMQALLRRLLTAEPLRMILYPEGWTP